MNRVVKIKKSNNRTFEKKEYSVVRKKEPSVVRDDAALFASRHATIHHATDIHDLTDIDEDAIISYDAAGN